MEPDVAGGGGGEPGGLEPPRRKRAGSGRTPAPALWDHPAPALPWARGQAGRVRRNQRRLQAGLLALLQDRCITVVFELFVRACLPFPAPRGCLYFLFHTWSSRTACGMRHPHQLNGALWGSFVPSGGCSDRLGTVCVCVRVCVCVCVCGVVLCGRLWPSWHPSRMDRSWAAKKLLKMQIPNRQKTKTRRCAFFLLVFQRMTVKCGDRQTPHQESQRERERSTSWGACRSQSWNCRGVWLLQPHCWAYKAWSCFTFHLGRGLSERGQSVQRVQFCAKSRQPLEDLGPLATASACWVGLPH